MVGKVENQPRSMGHRVSLSVLTQFQLLQTLAAVPKKLDKCLYCEKIYELTTTEFGFVEIF